MDIHPWIDTIKKLSCVRRFSQTELAKPENVLEHSAMVAAIVLHIATGLEAEDKKINVRRAITKALIHDIEESILGDIAKPSKYSNPGLRDMFQDVETGIAYQILNPMADGLFDDWLSAKDGMEGSIVAFADTFCALIKFHDEIVIRGNRSMVPLLQPTAIPTLERKLKAIQTNFGSGPILDEYFAACERLTTALKKETGEQS